MIGIGAIFGFLYLETQIKNNKINFQTDKNIYKSIIISIFGGLLGAKTFEMIYKQIEFTISNFFECGMTFYGGLIIGSIIFFIINNRLKTNNVLAFNLLAPSIILFHGFGRLGCFLAGCCYGKPTDIIIGVSYPEGSLPYQHFSCTKLHPTQLYEAAFLFILFLIIIKFVSFKKRTAIYFLSYSIFRFLIEFIRADYRGTLLTDFLSPSQIISIFFLIIGYFLLLSQKTNTKHHFLSK
jgi:phosphatidylglycerol:prolipoprotein diacylglycerol transferase